MAFYLLTTVCENATPESSAKIQNRLKCPKRQASRAFSLRRKALELYDFSFGSDDTRTPDRVFVETDDGLAESRYVLRAAIDHGHTVQMATILTFDFGDKRRSPARDKTVV